MCHFLRRAKACANGSTRTIKLADVNPIYCALDTTDKEQANALVADLKTVIGGVKIGMTYFYAHGVAGMQTIAQHGLPIFLDLKLHDIPNTVAHAVRALCPLKPAILNVHVSGGGAMMQAAAKAAAEFGAHAPLLIGVTVLTSLEENDLHDIGMAHNATEQTLRLANLAQQAGLDGIVCAAHDIAELRRECGADFKLIVPGIRPAGEASHDQKRIMTPKSAYAAGADILVIGRPITNAANPADAARQITQTLL